VERGWHTWRVLRERSHLKVTWGVLSRGRGRIEQTGRKERTITLDVRLDRRERSEVLGHELIHDEFDMLWPPGMPKGLVEKSERFIDQTNVDRSVPEGALKEFIEARVESDLPVMLEDVVEAFDVSERLARLAIEKLQNPPMGSRSS
jgi:hypothetical protein